MKSSQISHQNFIQHFAVVGYPRSGSLCATTASTAWQALVHIGRLKENAKVLVNGASGGVGSFAVQIARH